MRFHVSFILLLITITVNASDLGRTISDYFQSDGVKELRKLWSTQRKPFENAVASMLKRSYDLSLYVNTPDLNITSGYMVNDNIVNVFFIHLSLREHLVTMFPEVSFSLDHNTLRVTSRLRKLFIDAEYIIYRNTSNIIYDVFKPYANSPFSYAQVAKRGSATIIGAGCNMISQSIVQMVGVSLRVGSTSVRITGCQFTVEIYSDKYKTPPVVAPYFSPQQSKDLEKLIANSQLEEIAARLQGTLTSIVNTTGLFGLNMPKYRDRQEKMLTETANFMTKVARKMNMMTQSRLGNMDLEDVAIVVDPEVTRDPDVNSFVGKDGVAFTGMKINGLDSVYSTRRGGPCMLSSMKVFDVMRYNRLQVRGLLQNVEPTTESRSHEFSVDLYDVGVFVTLNVEPEGSQRRGGMAKRGKKKGKKKISRDDEEDVSYDYDMVALKEDDDVNAEDDNTDDDNVKKLANLDTAEPINMEVNSVRRFGYRGWRQSRTFFTGFTNIVNFKSVYDDYTSLLTAVIHEKVRDVVMKHFFSVFDDAVSDVKEGKDGGYVKLFNKNDKDKNDELINEVGTAENNEDDGNDLDEMNTGNDGIDTTSNDHIPGIYLQGRSNRKKTRH